MPLKLSKIYNVNVFINGLQNIKNRYKERMFRKRIYFVKLSPNCRSQKKVKLLKLHREKINRNKKFEKIKI